MKLKSLLISAIFLFISTSTSTSQSLPDNQLKGQVYGIVTDIQDAVVVNTTVEARSDNRVIRTQTDGVGAYKLNLPVGIYQIIVTSQGFCPGTRALFKVEQGRAINFDLSLTVCAHANGFIIKDGKYTPAEWVVAPYQDDSIVTPFSKEDPLKLFVRYGKREERGLVITYTGFSHKISSSPDGYTIEKPIGVTASYNLLTIQADKIEFDRQTNRLKASGNIRFADGAKHVKANLVDVTFKDGVPEINIH